MKKLKLLFLVTLLGMMPILASAGEEANAPTATGETGLFTLLSGETLPQGQWSFGLYYNNWDRLLEFDGFDLEEDISVDWNRLSASLGYGLTDRWEVSLMVPYDDIEVDDDDLFFDDDGADASGLGNARLGTKFRLTGAAGEDTSKLALNLFAELPTGDEDVASDDVGFGVGLGWSRANWVFDVGYKATGDDDDVDIADELHAGLGYASSINDRFDWITEVVGTFYQSGDVGFDDAVDLTTGGRLWLGETGNWALNFGLRTDLMQLSDIDEHCPIGGLLGLTFFPRLFQEEVVPPPPPPPPPAPAPEPAPPAPAPPPPPPPPAPPAPEEMEVVCEFTPGSARTSNICKAKLDEVALRMKQEPDSTAKVVGYADGSTGSQSSNQRIAEQRAEAVKSYIVTRHGIDPSRITTEGQVTDRLAAVVILTIP